MHTCTLVIEDPTEPIRLGMTLAGGRVTAAHIGPFSAEKRIALQILLEEIGDLRHLKAGEHYMWIISEKLARVNGFAFGIHAAGMTSIDEHRRMHDLAFNAYSRRFDELCQEHIPGWHPRTKAA